MNKAVLREVWTGRSIGKNFPLIEWIGGNESTALFRTEVSGAKAAVRIVRASGEVAAGYLAAWEQAAGLSHPNLMRVIASGKVADKYGDVVYLVTEYADETLGQIIPDRSLTAAEVREMLPPVLEALTYLHRREFVYRQLRPSNIQVVGDQIKLPLEGLVRVGTLESVRSSRIYDAPEIGSLNTSPAADMWSLGATIVEALTQKAPVWNRAANGDPTIPPSVPAPFAEIARRCLRSEPTKRLSLAQVNSALKGAALPPEPVAPQAKAAAVTPTPPAEAVKAGAVKASEVKPVETKPTTPQVKAEPAPVAKPPVTKPAPAPAAASVAAAPTAARAHVPQFGARDEEPAAPASLLANRKVWLVAAIVLVVVIVLAITVGRAHKDATPPAATQPAAPPTATGPASSTPAPSAPAANAPAANGGSAQGEVTNRVQPDIPEHAMGTIRGKIEIDARLHVDAQGNVTGASLSHRGSSRYFATRVLDAVRQWKFRAPVRDGRPVASEWTVRFALRRSGLEATPEQIRP